MAQIAHTWFRALPFSTAHRLRSANGGTGHLEAPCGYKVISPHHVFIMIGCPPRSCETCWRQLVLLEQEGWTPTRMGDGHP